MSSELITMIILNAYLVAALLTVIDLCIKTKKKLERANTLYYKKSDEWFDLVNENASLRYRISRLEGKTDETVQSND